MTEIVGKMKTDKQKESNDRKEMFLLQRLQAHCPQL